MEINPEVFFEKSPKPISFGNTEKILFQMKNCICKIYKENGKKGTGFFCKIPYPNQSNLLKVLITNNHILNEDDLKDNNIIKCTLKDDKEIREIILDKNKRKIYTSKELDITIIEIKENDNINEFLEIDEEIINQNKKYIETTYKNKSIYILHYPLGGDIVVSYGILDKINNEQINHFCNTLNGSSGSPILSLETFKVIGIHCGSNKDENEKCNKGIFIKYPIKEFNKQNKKIFYLFYKFNPMDPNCRFIEMRIFGDKFVENNKDKCKMIINDNEFALFTHIYGEIVNGSFEIKLKEIKTITDMSYMFYKCNYLPDISKWDTSNVTNMSGMFSGCNNIPDISKWDTSNVTNMSGMFSGCKNFPDISKWDTSNVIDMSFMFCCCEYLPDISKWNTSNVINMCNMFYHCTNLPDISKWDTSNVTDMSYMFHKCNNIPDISKWNTSNVINIKGIFGGFTNLPDISRWDTSKIDNISLLTLKSSPINIEFYDTDSGRRIFIVGDEIMTFSNLFKIFYTKANISNDTKNFIFYFDGRKIDPNSNKLLKDLNFKNYTRITFLSY